MLGIETVSKCKTSTLARETFSALGFYMIRWLLIGLESLGVKVSTLSGNGLAFVNRVHVVSMSVGACPWHAWQEAALPLGSNSFATLYYMVLHGVGLLAD